MAQDIFPFLHSPVDADEFLKIFDGAIRDGVLDGNQATSGSGSWNVTIKAGKSIISGTYVHDDLDKIDALNLGHVAGADRHYIVYQTYAYSNSDPPSASLFAVTAGAAPPTQPTIPAGAVKLCDIFVPAAAANIGTVSGGSQADPVQVSSTGVRFVQAQRVWATQDTGELLDRLALAAGHTMIYTAGAITYDDTAGTLALSQPVVVQTLCSTNRQRFQQAPAFVRATIPATGGTPLSVPGVAGSRDVVVYTVVDRSVPTEALAATIKFLNRANPSASELNELLNYSNRTSIIILGVVVGDKLHLPGVAGGSLPSPDASNIKYLRNNSAGSHTWELVEDTHLVGGHMVVADVAARNAIPNGQRKRGMYVYVIADDRWYTIKAVDVTNNANWVLATDDSNLAGGLRVVADNTARNAIGSDLRKQGMVVYSLADETFYALIGGTANGNFVALQDDSRFVGGMRVVADAVARQAIPLLRQKVGMVVFQVDTFTFYRLRTANAGSPVWTIMFRMGDTEDGQLKLDNGGGNARLSVTADAQAVGGAPGGVFNAVGGDISFLGAAAVEAAWGSQRSRVLLGAECLPALEGGVGPAASVQPGRAVCSAGVVLEWSSALVADANDSLNPTDPTFSAGPANIYIFVRHTAGNGTVCAAKWSKLPPNSDGTPSDASFETDYNGTDYCYVGMLRYLDDNNVGGWSGVWGYFDVSYPMPGVREVHFDPFEAALTGGGSVARAAGTGGTVDVGPATALATLFPTARQIKAYVAVGCTDTGPIAAYTAHGSGFRMSLSTTLANQTTGSEMIVNYANRAERIRIRLDANGANSGSITISYSGRIIGIIENVNDPVAVAQANFEP